MKIENPAALRFIIDDDLYLLNSDKIAAPAPNVQPVHRQPTEAQPVTGQQITVVEQPVVVQSQPETPAVDFKYKGANKKNFLVLVHYPLVDFMEEAHLTALESILKRKDLALDDIAIVNIPNCLSRDIKELTAYFKPQRLLIMGKDALPVDLAAPALNLVGETDGIKTLYSFSFGEMMDSNDNKKMFWEQMKVF